MTLSWMVWWVGTKLCDPGQLLSGDHSVDCRLDLPKRNEEGLIEQMGFEL